MARQGGRRRRIRLAAWLRRRGRTYVARCAACRTWISEERMQQSRQRCRRPLCEACEGVLFPLALRARADQLVEAIRQPSPHTAAQIAELAGVRRELRAVSGRLAINA